MIDIRIASLAIDFFVKSDKNLKLVIQGSVAMATSETFLVK